MSVMANQTFFLSILLKGRCYSALTEDRVYWEETGVLVWDVQCHRHKYRASQICQQGQMMPMNSYLCGCGNNSNRF